MMTVYDKLLFIQQNLKAPKGQYNDFGNYHYRSCEDIQEAVKPLLKEVNAVLLTYDELVQIGERYYIKATVKLCDCEIGDSITNTAYAREADSKPKMDPAQITGSASSYARKYALNGLFCIDDSKDPDVPMGKPEQEPKKQEPKKRQQAPKKAADVPTDQELRDLQWLAFSTQVELSKICERYGVKDITELNRENYEKAMYALRRTREVKEG